MRNLQLPPVTKRNILDATKEFSSVLIAAFLPIWLSIILSWLSPKANVSKFATEFLSSGEALLISAALVGPLIYVLFKQYGNMPRDLSLRFPFGWFIISMISVILVTSAGVFGYKSATPRADNIAPDNMFLLSVVVLVTSLIILLLVYIIRNHMEEPPSKIMRAETSEFIESWDES